MKKLLIISTSLLLVLSFSSNLFGSAVIAETMHNDWFFLGDFHTYDYASAVNFADNCTWLPGFLTGTLIGTDSDPPDDLCFGHTLPGSRVPPDQVTRAKLFIDAYDVDRNGNEVEVGGVLEWNLNSWDFWSIGDNSIFDLSNVTVPGFWNGSALGVCIEANECDLRIDQSILMMDYDTCPVPEPGTMLMHGMGLLGTGFIFRRKK